METHSQNTAEKEAIQPKIMSGEELFKEFGRCGPFNPIECKLKKFEEVGEGIKSIIEEDVQEYGSDSAGFFETIAMLKATIQGEKRKSDWHQIAIHLIAFLASTDPTPIHYQMARSVIEEDLKENHSKENFDKESTDKAVDLVTRSLLDKCQEFKKVILGEAWPIRYLNSPYIANDNSSLEFIYPEQNGVLFLDDYFFSFLAKIGKESEKITNKHKKFAQERYRKYADNYKIDKTQIKEAWKLWINENKPFKPLFLRLLAEGLWRDKLETLWNRETKGHPSLAKPIIDKLIPILGPSKTKKFTEKEGQIICYDQQGEPLLTAPAVDVNMIAAFQKGIKELGSLTGHKMIRWQVNAGFEQWIQGLKDPRLIEIDGGYSKISELIGSRSTHEIARIKEILNAQAFGRFIFSDGSHGNMITLRIEERYKNNEPSKIRIVLGDILLPGYVCQLQRSDRRLIPISDLPPLHGSPNTHAGQAQLQLLVLAEFSNQSDRLAQEGSVSIPIEKWKLMAYEAGLNPDRVELVIAHWSQPDLFNCFLDRQGDEYRLASHYERAQRFLEIQGENRVINSKRGKHSAEKQKEKRKKI